MFPRVDTADVAAVEQEVKVAYKAMFPAAAEVLVVEYFRWATDAFEGRYGDYLPVDARYHDFEHTLQGTLCMVRILRGRHEAGVRPVLTQRIFELGLLAILLHDTGYLKRRGDESGTGAKYTLTHVARSVQFAELLLGERGLAITEIRAVQNMIRCTGVHVDLDRIPFQSEVERVVGYALGTGDLLGQMSAGDYIDKLGILFEEFEESAKFYEGKMTGTLDFRSEEELKQNTPVFWSKYVLPKLDQDFWGVYKFLSRPYPGGRNEYIDRVEANVDRLRARLAGK
ncbi:MAG: hypothetical protein RI897_1767 [Verrucomicrobiota bacterium]|jgi:hypothetical protein